MEKRKFRTITLLADIVILTISFLAMLWTKPASLKSYLPSHLPFFLGLALMWIIVSLINGKMHRGKIINFSTLFSRVLTSNIIAISITALAMYSIRAIEYSRTIVLGTALLATFLELFFGSIYMAYKKAVVQDYDEFDKYKTYKKPSEYDLVRGVNGHGDRNEEHNEVNPGIALAIEKECGSEMASAILKMTCSNFTDHTAVLSTTTVFNITSLVKEKYDYIINLHKINDIKRLDSFLDAVNSKLAEKGFFFCCVETKDQRKHRLLKKYPLLLNYIYYFFDFILKRILPKLKFTRGIYLFLTRGENAVLSRAETLGRICRAGFRIKQESFIGNLLCIEARKSGEPLQLNENVYGPLIALSRVGKNGNMIKVYKLRTMHPYSEYIQDYVYEIHDLRHGGKFKNDFRITSWGAICRQTFLDEMPMLMNFFRGDMKLIGVRPLSKQYFELYRKEVRDRRIKYKPGLIPPFYADMPSDLDGIQASELKYLDSFDGHPFFTDFRYFWKSVWNILFRKARSN
ncbi:MAG: sugar transferase [Bacteroidales bacterium]|jgi:lipopolysaccharide/colanic/teichoic acid biosynthesis glycosyltransferase